MYYVTLEVLPFYWVKVDRGRLILFTCTRYCGTIADLRCCGCRRTLVWYFNPSKQILPFPVVAVAGVLVSGLLLTSIIGVEYLSEYLLSTKYTPVLASTYEYSQQPYLHGRSHKRDHGDQSTLRYTEEKMWKTKKTALVIALRSSYIRSRVVKLPVIYVGGKLPVTYRPLPARMDHRALVLKGVGQSLGPMTVIITRWTFLKFEVCDFGV